MWIALSVIAVMIVAVLVIAANKPAEFRVERSREIAAPPERILAVIEDFRQWMQWSPYEKKDPNSKRTYSGAEKGRGAVYAWNGNRDIGAGRMEILEMTAQLVRIKLEFFKPMHATSTAEFTLAPAGNGTRVTWAMIGNMNFVCKVISVFVDTDKMCGPDFARGLEAMEAAVTGEGRQTPKAELVSAH